MPDYDWTRNYTLALELAKYPSREDCARAAISRAYYAAFHMAARRLKGEGDRSLTGTGEDHYIVWERFKLQRQDSRRKNIGEAGVRLRIARRQADYDDEIVSLSTVLNDAMADALEVLNRLKNLP